MVGLRAHATRALLCALLTLPCAGQSRAEEWDDALRPTAPVIPSDGYSAPEAALKIETKIDQKPRRFEGRPVVVAVDVSVESAQVGEGGLARVALALEAIRSVVAELEPAAVTVVAVNGPGCGTSARLGDSGAGFSKLIPELDASRFPAARLKSGEFVQKNLEDWAVQPGASQAPALILVTPRMGACRESLKGRTVLALDPDEKTIREFSIAVAAEDGVLHRLATPRELTRKLRQEVASASGLSELRTEVEPAPKAASSPLPAPAVNPSPSTAPPAPKKSPSAPPSAVPPKEPEKPRLPDWPKVVPQMPPAPWESHKPM